jgi:hypothetical protein
MNDHTAETAQVDAALRFDPLAAAEYLTGESYKDDTKTSRLGFALALQHNAAKEALLRGRADSFFAMDFRPSLDLFTDLGFEEVLRDTFVGRNGADETYVILWHPDGILATCESYSGTSRNSAKVYYNYRHESGGYPGLLISSGSMHGDVWAGDHDAREGVRHNLRLMRNEGEFLSPWVVRPWLWLLAYSDTDGDYDYAAINAERISRLPEHVRRAITPTGQAGGDDAS